MEKFPRLRASARTGRRTGADPDRDQIATTCGSDRCACQSGGRWRVIQASAAIMSFNPSGIGAWFRNQCGGILSAAWSITEEGRQEPGAARVARHRESVDGQAPSSSPMTCARSPIALRRSSNRATRPAGRDLDRAHGSSRRRCAAEPCRRTGL